MNGVRTGTKTAKTVLQNGEFEKTYTSGVESWSDETPGRGEQTDEDIKSAWNMDPESQGSVFILPKS